MNWYVWGIFFVTGALLVVIVVSAWIVQSIQKRLFYPVKEHIWKPDVKYEEINIEGISAWYFSHYPKNKTVLFCHGNAGNISHRSYIIAVCLRQKLNLLLFDYRGFGKSEGEPSQENVCQDGATAYQYLVKNKNISPDNIIIWGESLGGAVATHVASKNQCYSLVLLSTFSALEDVMLDKEQPWYILFVISFMKRYIRTMPNKEWIKCVKAPVVILHSTEDELIPMKNAERLYDAISHNCKRLIKIRGEHSSPNISIENLQELFRFCFSYSARRHCEKCKHILDKALANVERHTMTNACDEHGVCLDFNIAGFLSSSTSSSSSSSSSSCECECSSD